MKVLFTLVLTFISFILTSQKIFQLQDNNKDVTAFIEAYGINSYSKFPAMLLKKNK